MASSHSVITMITGTPVQVGSNVKRRSTFWMQPRATNAAPIYIGTASNITNTNYGVRLDPAVSGVPPPPFNPGEFSSGPEQFRSPLRTSEFYALGTTGDYLHVLIVDY